VSNRRMEMQDGFLNFLRRERIPVAVHLFTGMRLQGLVRGFDTYTFILEQEGTQKQMLIFKHGVLYIEPMRPVGDVVGRLLTELQQAEQAKQTAWATSQQTRPTQKRSRRLAETAKESLESS